MSDESQETCLCIDLRSAANRVTQIYDQAMAPSGISVTQFSQLHLIQSLGSPTLKELAKASGLDRSTLGRNIRVLESLGLVDIRAGKDDARTRRIIATGKGKNAFKRAIPLWHQTQTELIERLGGAKRRAELKGLLNELMGGQA